MGLHLLAAVTPGSYINGLLVIPVVIVLVVWAKLLTWVDKDALANRLGREKINSALLGGFVAAFVLFLVLPNFLLAFAALLAAFGIEAAVYLNLRKAKVGSTDDLKAEFKAWVRSFGGKPKEVEEVSGAVQLVGANGQLLPAPKKDTPEAAAYDGIQRLLADPLVVGADQVDLTPTDAGSTVRYTVDGVGYDGATVSGAVAADALVYLKAAAGLDVGEVRKPQSGGIKMNVSGKRRDMRMETAGNTAGESARFTADAKGRHSFTPATLGLTDDQLATIKKINDSGGGITVLAAPRGLGLTSLAYGMVKGHDSFLHFIQSIERDPEQELEGISQNKLDRNATPAEETKQVNWIISQQPEVLLVGKPQAPETVAALAKAAADGRRIYVTVNAPNAFDALTAFKRLAGDDPAARKAVLDQVQLVINGRPIRKLCLACKQAYTPDPDQLRKLNMDPARVTELFQARKEPPRDAKGNPVKCDFCHDLRYHGRTGIFEVLVVDDAVRQVATGSMTPEQNASLMKTAFRKQRGKYLQESGLLMVEHGDTSVQEVLRVLKPPAEAAAAAPRKSSSRRRPPPPPTAEEQPVITE